MQNSLPRYGVLGGCQGVLGSYLCCYVFANVFWVVARVLWAVTCVSTCLPGCSGWLPGCCYVVARVFRPVCCLWKTPCYAMVFWVVARVLLGCSGHLFVLLCGYESVWADLFKTPCYDRVFIGGCQGVARVFWAVACVAVCLPGCFYLVARVLWLVSCLCKTPCYYLGDVLLSGSCCGWFLVLLCGCRGIWCNFRAYVWLPECWYEVDIVAIWLLGHGGLPGCSGLLGVLLYGC